MQQATHTESLHDNAAVTGAGAFAKVNAKDAGFKEGKANQ